MKTFFYPFLILFAGVFVLSCSDDDTTDEQKTDDGPEKVVPQQLDYSYFYDASKTLTYRIAYKYNKKGQITSTETSRRAGNEWEGLYVEDYTYDSNDSLTQKHSYNADADGKPSADITQFKTEYTRNSKGQLLSEAMYMKEANQSEWVNEDHKCDYTYDAAGRMVSYIYYDCMLPYRTFEQSRKFEYKYDGNGNRVSGERNFWDGFNWYVNAKFEYTYDAENRLTREESDYSGSKDRMEYTYNAIGKPATVVYSRYNGSSWEPSEKQQYLYNNQGNETAIVIYVQKNNTMAQYSKNEFRYDDNNNLIYSAYYTFKNGQWTLDSYRENYFADKK